MVKASNVFFEEAADLVVTIVMNLALLTVPPRGPSMYNL